MFYLVIWIGEGRSSSAALGDKMTTHQMKQILPIAPCVQFAFLKYLLPLDAPDISPIKSSAGPFSWAGRGEQEAGGLEAAGSTRGTAGRGWG